MSKRSSNSCYQELVNKDFGSNNLVLCDEFEKCHSLRHKVSGTTIHRGCLKDEEVARIRSVKGGPSLGCHEYKYFGFSQRREMYGEVLIECACDTDRCNYADHKEASLMTLLSAGLICIFTLSSLFGFNSFAFTNLCNN